MFPKQPIKTLTTMMNMANVRFENTNQATQKSKTDMKTKYCEVRNDYYDESAHFTTIDAWKSDDDNEEGKVVAVVHDSGDYWIIDPDASYDPKVMNAINEVRSRLIEDANPLEKLSRDIVIEQEKPLMLCSWLLP